MGKSLKGKECGKGIYQRKDGKYSARFNSKAGKRVEKYFDTISEARRWLAVSVYEDQHDINVQDDEPPATEMTVNEWFDFWVNNLICDLSPNTIRNYKDRYRFNIQPVIGKKKLSDVKPMHCKTVLNRMNAVYAGSTIRQVFITMGTLFRAAMNNDLITKHPMDGVRYTKAVKAVDDIKFLTEEEQAAFLKVAALSHNYRQYVFLLETGLRTSEMIGLTWDSIDWEKRTLTISKNLEYRHCTKVWRAGPPKTVNSYRTIPLTHKAYQILKDCFDERETRKEADGLSQVLEYLDCRSGQKKKLFMKDLVFVNYRTGMPNKNSSYDTHLYKLCDMAGIRRFCMHALRHTYATRAIERGVPPKVLQRLLGHASIKTTMDRYVHVSDDSLEKAIHLFEQKCV